MNHIFVIRLSVDEHLGYFLDLAVVNSAAMNIGVHISFQIMVFSGYALEVGWLDYMTALVLVFKDPPYCRPLFLPPLIPPSIRVFSNEPTLRVRWP